VNFLEPSSEFFGTEQSGMPNFRHANIVRDQDLLKQARVLAFDIIDEDFNLENPKNKVLSQNYFNIYYEKEKLFDF
jgi:ATP-dependent DNA helicase RecG